MIRTVWLPFLLVAFAPPAAAKAVVGNSCDTSALEERFRPMARPKRGIRELCPKTSRVKDPKAKVVVHDLDNDRVRVSPCEAVYYCTTRISRYIMKRLQQTCGETSDAFQQSLTGRNELARFRQGASRAGKSLDALIGEAVQAEKGCDKVLGAVEETRAAIGQHGAQIDHLARAGLPFDPLKTRTGRPGQ